MMEGGNWWILPLIIFIFLWYRLRTKWMTVFKSIGIPGPKPHFIFGNLKEIQRKGAVRCQKEWIEKYGDIVGFYMGAKPILLINDTELLKSIQIKDFHHFPDRMASIPKGLITSSAHQYALSMLRGRRWKEIRSIITPTFSASKMKQMVPLMKEAIDTLMEKIEEKGKESFDIYELYQGLTLDVITKSAFGIQTKVQRNRKNSLIKATEYITKNESAKTYGVLILCFPEFSRLVHAARMFHQNLLSLLGKTCDESLYGICSQVVDVRRKNPKAQKQDLLQLMLDASVLTQDLKDVQNNSLIANFEVVDTTREIKPIRQTSEDPKTRRFMTDMEITGNAGLFLLAGYETTSSALGFITHILVNHPEVQDALREEIKNCLEEGNVDYTSVSKLHFMDRVVMESLRLYPPVTAFVGREAAIDVHYNGYLIPRGTHIQAAVWQLHHDTRYWDSPETFDPDRFLPENKSKMNPMAFQPFGMGPRNCVGMRFALMQIKLVLVRILKSHRFEPCQQTELGEAEMQCKAVTNNPRNGVFVSAVRI